MADEKTSSIWSSPPDWRATLAAGSEKSTHPPAVVKKEFIADIEVQEDRTVKFVISTGGEDREKDVIDPGGWAIDNYMANPVVMFAHDYNSLPVAKTISLEMHGESLVATAQFAEAELNPLAEQVFQMLKGGFLTGASVGFRPTEFAYNETRGGIDFASQELLEFSVVPVPANPQALIAAGVQSGDVDLIVDWARRTLQIFDNHGTCEECPPDETASEKSDDVMFSTSKDVDASFLEERIDSLEKRVIEFQSTTELLVRELRKPQLSEQQNESVVFELDDDLLNDDEQVDIDVGELASSLSESVKEAVGSEVERSINALRGRVN